MVSARQMLWRALAIHGWPENTAMIEEMAKKGPSKERRAVREALGMRPIYGEDLELATRPHIDIENLVAKIHTSRGSFTISLLDDEAPGTVSNFVALARRGFYDGLSVHRVVPGFVIQAGDPRGDGFGGPGYNIACENSPRRYRRGVVGMALAGRDTGGSQFFITQAEHPHLDAAYTAFALVHDGMNVVDSLQIGDVIVAIEIFQAPTVQSQAHSQRHP
jgi:cyclophilin family peptidyl-prolyl cis-trans isomerase